MRRDETISAAQYGPEVEAVVRQVDRLTTLIDSLLDVSRLMAGRLKLEVEEVDLAQTVREVTARMAEDAGRAGCDVSVDADVPAIGTTLSSRGRRSENAAPVQTGRGRTET